MINLSLFLIMSAVIAFSYWLEEHTRWAAHLSGVLLIIVIASILGNSGIVPISPDSYSFLLKWLMPLGIILMLLAFHPKDLLKINKEFVICFFTGAVATSVGGIIAGFIFHTILPQDYWRISGQFTASFIGGYENAVSVGTALDTPMPVFLKAFAGDSILTTLWIIVNVFQGKSIQLNNHFKEITNLNTNKFSDSLDIASIAITVTVAICIFQISIYLHQIFSYIPEILYASVIATLITFTPLKHRFSDSYIFGSFLLSYFIFSCGAISNVSLLFTNAIVLLIFPATIIAIHAIILFSIAKILKIKNEIAITSSQILIGGPATALAVVIARKWNYQFEAITLGLLGYAIGNYFGFAVAWILK